MKFYTKVVLVLIAILWMTACTGLGFSFEDKRTMILTRSPYQLSIAGDVSDEVTNNAIRLINEMGKYPYKNYTFNPSLMVDLSASDISTESTSSSSNVNRSRTRDIYNVVP